MGMVCSMVLAIREKKKNLPKMHLNHFIKIERTKQEAKKKNV